MMEGTWESSSTIAEAITVSLAESTKAEHTQIYDKAVPLLHVYLTVMP